MVFGGRNFDELLCMGTTDKARRCDGRVVHNHGSPDFSISPRHLQREQRLEDIPKSRERLVVMCQAGVIGAVVVGGGGVGVSTYRSLKALQVSCIPLRSFEWRGLIKKR